MAKTGLGQRRNGTPSEQIFLLETEPYYCHEDSWRKEAGRFDTVIWPLPHTPWEADEAVEKIFFLEKILKKRVYPSFDQILLYENRAFQHHQMNAAGLPVVSAFNSCDYDEAVAFIRQASYPLYFYKDWGKGPGAYETLKSYRAAKKKAESAFRLGLPGAYPGHRSKQGLFFIKVLDPGCVRKWACGIDGKIIPSGNDNFLSDKASELLKKIFLIPGFGDFKVCFRSFPEMDSAAIEAVSPLLADFILSREREQKGLEEERSIHSYLRTAVVNRLFQEMSSASDAAAIDGLPGK